MSNTAYCAYVYNIIADYLIADALAEYDAATEGKSAIKDARATKLYNDNIYNHRKVYKTMKCEFYREKNARHGKKGVYKTHKVKGEVLPGNLAYDLG